MKFRTQLVSGYMLVLAFVLILAILTYTRVTELLETNQWVTHTLEVTQKAAILEKSIVDQETGERGFLLTGVESFLEPYVNGKATFEVTMASLKTLVADNPSQVSRLEDVERIAEARDRETAIPLIEMRRNAVRNDPSGISDGSQHDIAEVVANESGKALTDSIRSKLLEFTEVETTLLSDRQLRAEIAAKASLRDVILGSIFVVVLGVPALLYVTRNTLRAVGGEPRDIALLAAQGAVGDLRRAVWGDAAGTTGILAAIQDMVESLRSQVSGIRDSVDVFASNSGEISATLSQMAAAASETAAAVAQTTATLEEVRQGANISSMSASDVADKARRNVEISRAGRSSVDATIKGIDTVRTQMTFVATSVAHLSEQGQSIGEIIGMVDDLSEQSNLLAVNAAIEAAKVGEYGRGFTVVAQEIRSLADQSKQATAQVRALLHQIQQAAGKAALATEQVGKAVDTSVSESLQSGKAIEQLMESAEETAEAAERIAAASTQQLAGVEQVTAAMDNIRESGEQNVAGTRQLETAAQTLSDMGQSLKVLVDRYRV